MPERSTPWNAFRIAWDSHHVTFAKAVFQLRRSHHLLFEAAAPPTDRPYTQSQPKGNHFFFVLRLPEPQASQNLYLAVAGTAETNGRLSFVPIRLKRKRESPPCRIAPRKIICQMQTDSAHRVNRHFVTYGWETLTLAGNAYRELPPVREPDAYTDVSRELSCELCSLALPDSTMYFMDTPPQGSPDNCLLGPGSNSAGSGGLYAPPASCWFVASLSFASRSSFAFWPAPYY